MNQAWSSGYVADVPYVEGFYVQQSPARMVLTCLLRGVVAELPAPTDEACYIELGCGMGFGALMTAASNPGWKVVAIDYNPAHIAVGVGLARAAGLDNIEFLEADVSQLSPGALPTADFITLHGLWSWVAPEVRAGIVRLLAAKTRPGAVVHISYNSLPGWQGAIGMQRLIYEAGMRAPGRSDTRVEAGMELARELKGLGAHYLVESNHVRGVLEREGVASQYLSHQYMNAHWKPAFHADVANALSEAKLDWVGSANPLENFPDLMMTAEQRKVMDRYSDPIMQELIKDTLLQRGLRHDIYVRGARRGGIQQWETAISRLTLIPVVCPDELQTTLDVPSGEVMLGEPLKEVMGAALQGPATVGELLARAPGCSSLAELASVMIGSDQWQPSMWPQSVQPEGADRLNRLLGGRVTSVVDGRGSALACGRLGTGLGVSTLLQFIAGRLLSGESEKDVDAWVAALSGDIVPEELDTLRKVIHTTLEQRVPLLRQLQIVPG
jgi:predicted methyltransferase family protein/methyltransferase family protein